MISQEEIDIIKGYLSEEEAIRLYNEQLEDLSKELVQCFICKGWHRRNEEGFVYHTSIPAQHKVVCLSHAGVKEWYEGLLKESRKYLEEMEKRDEVTAASD